MQCIVYWGPQRPGSGAPNHLAPALLGALFGGAKLPMTRRLGPEQRARLRLLMRCVIEMDKSKEQTESDGASTNDRKIYR